MSNMSYCRFENTLADLQDCYEALQEVSPEDLSLYKTFNVVSELDMVASANISEFVNQAMEENKNFGMLTRKEQDAIIKGYAMQKMKDITPEPTPNPIVRTDIEE